MSSHHPMKGQCPAGLCRPQGQASPSGSGKLGAGSRENQGAGAREATSGRCPSQCLSNSIAYLNPRGSFKKPLSQALAQINDIRPSRDGLQGLVHRWTAGSLFEM